MKNVLIALCWLVSLGVLSLHAESFEGSEVPAADSREADKATAAMCGRETGANPAEVVEPRRFAALNFGAPLHLAGQKPATGNGSIMPAGLSGNPQVVAATPVLPNQPLLLNTELANGPCCYEEGIQVLVAEESAQYVVSFDLASQQLGDSFNQFQLWLNDDSAPLLRFQPDYLVVLEGVGAIASFRDDHLLHVQVQLDLQAGQLQVAINGEPLYAGELALTHLHSLQFLLTAEGGATPEQVNPEASVALDNIVVANASYEYVNLQATLQRSADEQPDGVIELLSIVQNVSAHTARDVILTHLLPAGTRVLAMNSEQMSCEATPDQVKCHVETLAALEQATVTLQLESAEQRQPLEVTAIATSQSDEIDNHDNRSQGRFAGNSSLLLLAALLLLWMAREWYEGH